MTLVMNFETVLITAYNDCVILSIENSYVQKIIVKDSSVNDFDLLTQAFVYYVSNIGHKNHWKKADLKWSKYVESLAKASLP